MKALAAVLLCLSLSAHADQATDAQHAALTDIGTTAIGLAMGAAEANPLGIATVPLKFILMDQASKLPDGEKQHTQAALASIWNGFTVNNLCVITAIATGGAFAPACVVAGVIAGVVNWQSTENERLFWAACAQLRTENPNLTCEFRS